MPHVNVLLTQTLEGWVEIVYLFHKSNLVENGFTVMQETVIPTEVSYFRPKRRLNSNYGCKTSNPILGANIYKCEWCI